MPVGAAQLLKLWYQIGHCHLILAFYHKKPSFARVGCQQKELELLLKVVIPYMVTESGRVSPTHLK